MKIYEKFANLIPPKLKKYIYNNLPKTDMHGFEYTVNELVGMFENSKNMASNWHGKILNNDILKYKTSDTIFLLGSGPSINSITPQQWNHIRQHNSIGFNYWFAHDFVPTYYMFQGVDNAMLDLLKDKNFEYNDIPFLLRGADLAQGKFDLKDSRLNSLKNNPVYYVNTFPFSSKCSIDVNLLFQFVEDLGLLTFGEIADFVPKFRGTLGLLISLSYQMGYKNIVLCGMDMKDSHHFWDFEPYKNIQKKYQLPGYDDTNLNSFTDKSWSHNTVPHYVYGLHDWMSKKSNVQILLINKETVLYPTLNIYN